MADIGKVVADEIKLLKRRLNHLEAVAREYGSQVPRELKVMTKKGKKMSEATKAKIAKTAKARWAKIKKGKI